MTDFMSNPAHDDDDPLAALFSSVDDTTTPTTSDASETGSAEDAFSGVQVDLMLEYWQAEVNHQEAQLRRLTRLGHKPGIAAVKKALAYARAQLQGLR